VLAGVTSAQGQFSIDLQECQIPLDDPANGRRRLVYRARYYDRVANT